MSEISRSVVTYWESAWTVDAIVATSADRIFFRDGGQHETLVRCTVGVAVAVLVVGMARTTQDERLIAAQRLQPGIQMAAGILVVDLHRNIHFDAAQRIDNVFEAVEVDLGIMGNGHARQLRYGFHRESGSADGMCSVQLVLPVFPHVYQGIAVDRDERRLLVHRSMRARMMLSLRN